MKNLIILSILLLTVSHFTFSQNLIWSNVSHPDPREVYGVAFTADGSKALSGSECHDTRLRLWDVVTGNLLWDYQLDSNLMCTAGVKFSSNGTYLAALEELGHLLLFNLSSGTPQLSNSINVGNGGAFALDFSPTSDRIAIAGNNNKLKIFDVASGILLHNITAHTGYIFGVAWSHTGLYIATCGQDDKIKIWDSTGVLIHTLSGHTGDVLDVKFSPADDFVISASADDKIKIWNRSTGALVYTINGHTGDVRSLAISPDGNYIFSGSNDQTSRIWNFNTYSQLASFNNPGAGKVYTVAWSPTENKVLTGTSNNQVLLWDIHSLVSSVSFPGNVMQLNLHPNPVKDFVSTGLKNMEVTYNIFSISGQLIQDGTLPKDGIIRTENLNPGFYSLQFDLANGVLLTTKFIKL